MSEVRQAARHVTKYNFHDVVYHRVTGDKGVIFGILLRPDSAPRYLVIFGDSRKDDECQEAELQDEPFTAEAK